MLFSVEFPPETERETERETETDRQTDRQRFLPKITFEYYIFFFNIYDESNGLSPNYSSPKMDTLTERTELTKLHKRQSNIKNNQTNWKNGKTLHRRVNIYM